MSGRAGKAITVVAVGAIGWYTGVNEQLKKDGNLRDDVYVRDFDDQPKSWQDVRNTVKETLNPALKDVPREELEKDLQHAEIRTDSVESTGKPN
ncbi:hypothetical protein FT663_01511 [Candidozyma haemuli var. vulneris]|nr:hypothetical protein FT662_02463 [[Candida] haemuloni var. vulneris]KAF3994391.1 hypothetical protein FT663_01511 [[Candida] haemuloni var. vulneris]